MGDDSLPAHGALEACVVAHRFGAADVLRIGSAAILHTMVSAPLSAISAFSDRSPASAFVVPPPRGS